MECGAPAPLSVLDITHVAGNLAYLAAGFVSRVGVLGLRRGFLNAGARNLILTLWPIDDEMTAPMMAEFYDRMHRGGTWNNQIG